MSDWKADRRRKREQWIEQFGAAYAESFSRTHSAQEAQASAQSADQWRAVPSILADPKSEIRLAGRLVAIRRMGGITFAKLRDESGDFQLCWSKKIAGSQELLNLLDIGDWVGVSGEFFMTQHQEPTLLVLQTTPLSKSLHPLPEKWAGVADQEMRYRCRYWDMVADSEVFQRFRLRSEFISALRDFFRGKNFHEVETPILSPQAGGAMAEVFRTHHQALDHEFVLRIALELPLKMVLGGGMERVFELGKCFRNEGSDPSHLQEFTMLEWYAAYENLATNLEWTKELLQTVTKKVFGTTQFELKNREGETLQIDFSAPWAEVSFAEVIKKSTGIDMSSASLEELKTYAQQELKVPSKDLSKMSRGNILDQIFKKTARRHLQQPTVVQYYPSDLKPLARPRADGTAECYQLVIAGWEVVNSYGELIDPVIQRQLLEVQAQAKAAGDAEAMEVDENFLRAMETGFPPMTGFGMGIDRLFALLTQQSNLRDVVLFPLLRPAT